MKRLSITIVAVALGLVQFSCGYFQAGSWEDDPNNWYRAFGQDQPSDVVLVHSLYTRYPHFTHEHLFYLEFQAPREFLDSMIAEYNLHPGSDRLGRGHLIGEGPGTPEWFLPNPVAEYEIWLGEGTLRDAQLFIDKNSGVAYFTHTQL
jgi:hypothetical protein